MVIPDLQVDARAERDLQPAPHIGLRRTRPAAPQPPNLPAEVWGKIAGRLDTTDTISLHLALNNKPSDRDVPNFANALSDPFLQRALRHIRPISEDRSGRPNAVPGGLGATFDNADTARGVWSRLGIAKHVMKLAGEQRGYAILALLTHSRLCRSARTQLAREPGAFDLAVCSQATRQTILQSLVHGPPLDARVMESALPRVTSAGIPLRLLPENVEYFEQIALGNSDVDHFTFLGSVLARQLKARPRPSELAQIGPWALAQHFNQQAANSAGETAALQNIITLTTNRDAVSAAVLERYAAEIGTGMGRAVHSDFYRNLTEQFLAHPKLSAQAVRLMATALCNNLKTAMSPLRHLDGVRLTDLIRRDPRVDQYTAEALALEIIHSTNGAIQRAAHFPFLRSAANDVLQSPNPTLHQKIIAAGTIVNGPFLRWVARTGDQPFLLLLRTYLRAQLPDEPMEAAQSTFCAPLRSWNNFCLSSSSALLTTSEKLSDLLNSFSRSDVSKNDRQSLVWSVYRQAQLRPDDTVAHSIALHIIRDSTNPLNHWANNALFFENMWCFADRVPPSWRSAFFIQTCTYFRHATKISQIDELLLASMIRHIQLMEHLHPSALPQVSEMATALHELTVDPQILPDAWRAIRHELRRSGLSAGS